MSKFYNTKFKPTKVGIIKAVGQKIGSLIKGKGKVSPTITKVTPAVGKSKIKKAVDDVKLSALKARGQMKKQSQDFDAEINKVKAKLGQTTQKLVGEPVTKSGVSKGKDMKKFKTPSLNPKPINKATGGRVGKMGGGMMGRRMGYSQGSNGKIKFDAKKSDLDKSGDLSKYEKARGMAIAKAMAKRKNKKKAI